jgi:hypothetical protein
MIMVQWNLCINHKFYFICLFHYVHVHVPREWLGVCPTQIILRSTILRDVLPCSLVEEDLEQFYCIQNISTCLPNYSVKSQKMEFHIYCIEILKSNTKHINLTNKGIRLWQLKFKSLLKVGWDVIHQRWLLQSVNFCNFCYTKT